MAIAKQEQYAALLAAQLKPDICQALKLTVLRVLVWPDSLMFYNSLTLQPSTQ